MNVLVTGGAGFIGSSLVRSLAGDGHSVRVLDDFSTGRPENLEGVAGDLDVLEGDVRDPAAVAKAVTGAEVVYHLAALPSVARSVADPRASHEVNVDGTLNLLLAAVEAEVRRLVYASSSSVYGDTPVLPKHEEMPVSPRSPYAAAKLAGEAYCRAFARVYPLETVCLRFFNVFGPRQDPNSQYAAVVPRFVTRMLAGEPAEVTGDGRQTRDFTFVDNAVQACRLAAEAGPDKRSYRADFAKISALLPGFQPQWTVEQGVREVYEAFRAADLELDDFFSPRFIRLKRIQQLIAEGRLDSSLRWTTAGVRA